MRVKKLSPALDADEDPLPALPAWWVWEDLPVFVSSGDGGRREESSSSSSAT